MNNIYSMAFFDAQNLYRHAKDAFESDLTHEYHHPNFDPIKLHARVAAEMGFTPTLTRLYTGVPVALENKMWADYWNNRVLALKRAGVHVFTRELRYYPGIMADGSRGNIPHEKGVDVRLALDVVRCARKKEFDAAIIFSQDQDLSEAADEVREIAREQGRKIEIISAFPCGAEATALRGINKTHWFRMDKDFYDSCLDPKDYRSK